MQLLDVLAAEVSGRSPGAFLPALDRILQQIVTRDGDVMEWQGALSTLRRHALPCLADDRALFRAEDLWQQARVMVGEVAQRARARKELHTAQRAETLREISQMLVTALTVEELMDLLAEQLPRLGINRCYIALYENPAKPAEWSRLALACDERGRIAVEKRGATLPLAPTAAAGALAG